MKKENLKKILDDYQHDKIYINEKFKSLKDKKLIIEELFRELKSNKINDDDVKAFFENLKIETQQILNISNKNKEIEKLINNLNQPYRNVFYLKYIEYLSFDEISHKMNYSTPRIYQLYNIGLNILLEKNNMQFEMAE